MGEVAGAEAGPIEWVLEVGDAVLFLLCAPLALCRPPGCLLVDD